MFICYKLCLNAKIVKWQTLRYKFVYQSGFKMTDRITYPSEGTLKQALDCQGTLELSHHHHHHHHFFVRRVNCLNI